MILTNELAVAIVNRCLELNEGGQITLHNSIVYKDFTLFGRLEPIFKHNISYHSNNIPTLICQPDGDKFKLSFLTSNLIVDITLSKNLMVECVYWLLCHNVEIRDYQGQPFIYQ